MHPARLAVQMRFDDARYRSSGKSPKGVREGSKSSCRLRLLSSSATSWSVCPRGTCHPVESLRSSEVSTGRRVTRVSASCTAFSMSAGSCVRPTSVIQRVQADDLAPGVTALSRGIGQTFATDGGDRRVLCAAESAPTGNRHPHRMRASRIRPHKVDIATGQRLASSRS